MPLSDDPRAMLAQLVVRLRAAPHDERYTLVEQLLPLLSTNRIPLAVRMAAAARAIDSLPDTTEAIRGVVHAITAGKSPARDLTRLRHLQHLTEKAVALDEIVAAREQKVKMGCPRCGVRLPRAEMAKHLWHEHGLEIVKGKTRGRERTVETIRAEYAAVGDPALFDRAAEVGGEDALRAWTAESASEEEMLALGRAGRERNAGLCPTCFAEVPRRVPELPSPLAIAHGRVAGDGYVASAGSVFSRRVSAILVAALILILFGGFVFFKLGLILSIAAYIAVFVALTPRTSPDDDAIDAAWRKLGHQLADRRDAARFLTRLCLTSFGRGDPMERANILNRIIARARDNPNERQLLAAALTLHIDDGGEFGRDRAAGIAELVASAFRGEQPAEFAEFVLAAYFRVPRLTAEHDRLRILLLVTAFEAELQPRDILDLCDASASIADAMRLLPHQLALLYGVWKNRDSRPWEYFGRARTVFELAATAPTTASKLLTREPDLLLVCDTPEEVEAELGPVLIASGGVSVGGVITLDPEANVHVEDDGSELIFGRHTLKMNGEIPEEFADELKAWLRFRAEVLATYPEIYLPSDSPPSSQLLTPFATRCPSCGTEHLPIIGAVGRALRN